MYELELAIEVKLYMTTKNNRLTDATKQQHRRKRDSELRIIHVIACNENTSTSERSNKYPPQHAHFKLLI